MRNFAYSGGSASSLTFKPVGRRQERLQKKSQYASRAEMALLKCNGHFVNMRVEIEGVVVRGFVK